MAISASNGFIIVVSVVSSTTQNDCCSDFAAAVKWGLHDSWSSNSSISTAYLGRLPHPLLHKRFYYTSTHSLSRTRAVRVSPNEQMGDRGMTPRKLLAAHQLQDHSAERMR